METQAKKKGVIDNDVEGGAVGRSGLRRQRVSFFDVKSGMRPCFGGGIRRPPRQIEAGPSIGQR